MVNYLPPRISENQLVYSIYSKNGLEKIQESVAKDVRCPTCGGEDAYYIGADWKAWCCMNPECWGPLPPEVKPLPQEQKEKERALIHDFKDYAKIPKKYLDAQLSTLDQPDSICQEIERWLKSKRGFFIFTGKSGAGKTYSACAAIDFFVRENPGKTGRFINFTELYFQWKGCCVHRGDEMKIVQELDRSDLLVLDDLGTRPPTDGFLEFVYQLICRREEGEGKTLITTNLTSLEIKHQFNDRILSRISSGGVLRFEGSDRRL
jgi:DNA replication protein DnaC